MSDLAVLGGPVDVVVRGGRVVPGPAGGLPTLDATGLVVAPGFVDLQCNGAGGIDLTAEPERLWEVGALLPRWGVTAWLPTIVTSPAAARERALAALRAGPPPGWVGATPLGLHVEGPFLAPDHRGAHPRALLAPPSREVAAGWSRSAGVRVVTLAPELPGALDLVHDLTGRGVVVSAGHTGASLEEATAAVDAGARWVTHLFNGMAPLHHRRPGIVGAALTDRRLRVGLIADGLHVHPATVAAVWPALRGRLTLVTDAVAALGAPPGPVPLGDRTVTAGPDGVRLPDGTLAGSDLSMDRAVRNLAAFTGCPLEEAVAAATAVPCALLGEADRGTLAPGAAGDLVLLTPEGEVAATIVAGTVAWPT
ncbi:MAG TPA: N-acetylglucosamine-6-phosphate deacetylase [Acidimicrobiales bacterium]